MPFTERTRLAVAKGMHGATGNLYLGLHEFAEMGFLLHFLRADDLFIDIGANVGTYTVLAAGEIGATCVACEPVPSTFGLLQQNILVNGIHDKVKLSMVAVGESEGTTRITTTHDAKNHIVDDLHSASSSDTTDVQLVSLDQLSQARCPRLVKIDVEGYERFVLKGAARTLACDDLEAVIVELDVDGMEGCCRLFAEHGFRPFDYFPYSRKLESRDSPTTTQNVIYVRDSRLALVRERLRTARAVTVQAQSI